MIENSLYPQALGIQDGTMRSHKKNYQEYQAGSNSSKNVIYCESEETNQSDLGLSQKLHRSSKDLSQALMQGDRKTWAATMPQA